LLQVVVTGYRKSGQMDLEAVEMLVRESMHRAGAVALERLLSMPARQAERMTCSCDQVAQHHGKRAKNILTALGPVGWSETTMSALTATKATARVTRNWMWTASPIRPACAA
jgi:hypothetical protein